jgi:hypothetical protein
MVDFKSIETFLWVMTLCSFHAAGGRTRRDLAGKIAQSSALVDVPPPARH